MKSKVKVSKRTGIETFQFTANKEEIETLQLALMLARLHLEAEVEKGGEGVHKANVNLSRVERMLSETAY